MPLNLPVPVSIAPTLPPPSDQAVIWRYEVNLDRQEVVIDFRSYSGKNQIGNNNQETFTFGDAQAILGAAYVPYQVLSKSHLYQLLGARIETRFKVKGTVS